MYSNLLHKRMPHLCPEIWNQYIIPTELSSYFNPLHIQIELFVAYSKRVLVQE